MQDNAERRMNAQGYVASFWQVAVLYRSGRAERDSRTGRDQSQGGSIEAYTVLLGGVFAEAVALSYDQMPADHIKFHLKSPAERTFGNLFTNALGERNVFREVVMKGSWIYLSKV